MVTLTAGGRTAPKPPPRASPVNRWHALLTTMLDHAVAYGKVDELYRKRKAWCEANWDHPLITEREQAKHFTWIERNELGKKMMDAAEAMSRVQGEMTDDERCGLGVILGCELAPYSSHRLAMTAAAMGTTDVFAIVARWLRDEQAEEEHATGDDMGGAERGEFHET